MRASNRSAMYLSRSSGFAVLIGMTALVLAIPFVAMQFTSEVTWTATDFAVAAALLLGTGAAYLIGAGFLKTHRARLILGCSLLMLVLLIWAQLAVGIFH